MGTQVRQDAIQEMIQDPKVEELDFILVVGGFDSSNTAHLVEIPHDAGKTVFHINEGDWLPTDRPLKIGVTSGASTPDAYVQDALERLVLLKAAISPAA